MTGLIEFFDLDDAIPITLLVCLLRFVGGQMDDRDSTVRWWTRGFAGAAFLLYAAAGVAHYAPSTAWEFAALALRSILAMGTAGAVACVLVPVACFFHRHLCAEPRRKERERAAEKARQDATDDHRREEAERERLERQRLDEEESRRREEIASRPPPPTREERMAAARRRHESTLALLEGSGLDAIELQAAKLKAKQSLLKELDGLL